MLEDIDRERARQYEATVREFCRRMKAGESAESASQWFFDKGYSYGACTSTRLVCGAVIEQVEELARPLEIAEAAAKAMDEVAEAVEAAEREEAKAKARAAAENN